MTLIVGHLYIFHEWTVWQRKNGLHSLEKWCAILETVFQVDIANEL
jgi:hypothetical protein